VRCLINTRPHYEGAGKCAVSPKKGSKALESPWTLYPSPRPGLPSNSDSGSSVDVHAGLPSDACPNTLRIRSVKLTVNSSGQRELRPSRCCTFSFPGCPCLVALPFPHRPHNVLCRGLLPTTATGSGQQGPGRSKHPSEQAPGRGYDF
jgi:hypothetical protein